MITRVSMASLLVAATVFLVAAFVQSDRTGRDVVQFGSLALVGLAWPVWWSAWLHAALRPTTARARAMAWSPVVVGATTLLLSAAVWMPR